MQAKQQWPNNHNDRIETVLVPIGMPANCHFVTHSATRQRKVEAAAAHDSSQNIDKNMQDSVNLSVFTSSRRLGK